MTRTDRAEVSRRRAPHFCLAFLALELLGCATVPITGRSQFSLITDQAVIASADQQFLAFLSQAERQGKVLSASDSPEAATTLQTVQRVGNRIIDAAELRSKFDWQILVIRNPQANAFVMPNGKIVVFDGLLAVTESDAGLAAVIGHELGHVVARHSAERMSQALLAQMAVLAVTAVVAAKNPQAARIAGAGTSLGAHFGFLLPFSRSHESDADRIGLTYMAMAGYDPAEAIGLWERMEARRTTSVPEFLSTHPSPATRRADIQAWLPEARGHLATALRRPASPPASGVAVRTDTRTAAGAAGLEAPSSSPDQTARPEPTTAFEAQLRAVDALRTRGVITDVEHLILRQRLIETVTPAALTAGSTTSDGANPKGLPPRPSVTAADLVGAWDSSTRKMTVLFKDAGRNRVEWEYEALVDNVTYRSIGTGTVARDGMVFLVGRYTAGDGWAMHKTITFSLRHTGDSLIGTGKGIRNVPFEVNLNRR